MHNNTQLASNIVQDLQTERQPHSTVITIFLTDKRKRTESTRMEESQVSLWLPFILVGEFTRELSQVFISKGWGSHEYEYTWMLFKELLTPPLDSIPCLLSREIGEALV